MCKHEVGKDTGGYRLHVCEVTRQLVRSCYRSLVETIFVPFVPIPQQSSYNPVLIAALLSPSLYPYACTNGSHWVGMPGLGNIL